jgi:hypothetical protein
MAKLMELSRLGSWMRRATMRSRVSQPHMSTSPEEGRPEPRLLDVVELQVASGRWPAGTEATVIEARGSVAVIEIADERGHTLDIVALPKGVLRPLVTPHQEHLAV